MHVYICGILHWLNKYIYIYTVYCIDCIQRYIWYNAYKYVYTYIVYCIKFTLFFIDEWYPIVYIYTYIYDKYVHIHHIFSIQSSVDRHFKNQKEQKSTNNWTLIEKWVKNHFVRDSGLRITQWLEQELGAEAVCLQSYITNRGTSDSFPGKWG